MMHSMLGRISALLVAVVCFVQVIHAQIPAPPADWGKKDRWESLNPGGGGQIQDVYFDRNVEGTIWFSSDMEGTYRSSDYGQSWDYVSRDLAHGMSFVITQEVGGNRTYQGGMLGASYSTNANASNYHDVTWEFIEDTYGDAIASIAVSKNNQTVILAPGWQNKDPQKGQGSITNPIQNLTTDKLNGVRDVYVSQDRGKTFKKVKYFNNNGYRNVFGVAIHPNNNNIYLGTAAGVFVSTNNGDSFSGIAKPGDAMGPAGNSPAINTRPDGGSRGVGLSPDGKHIYAVYQTSGGNNDTYAVYVAKTSNNGITGGWTKVTNGLLTTAEWYDPKVDPRSTATKHKLLLGTVWNNNKNRKGLWEGTVNFNGSGDVTSNSWEVIANNPRQNNCFDFEMSWEVRDFIVRAYDYTPKWYSKHRIITMGGMNVYMSDVDDPKFPCESWKEVYGEVIYKKEGLSMSHERGFSSPYCYDVDAIGSYMIQGCADHGILQSLDYGYSWTSEHGPAGVTNSMSVLAVPSNPPVVIADMRKGFGIPNQGAGALYGKKIDFNNIENKEDWRLIGGAVPNSSGTTMGLISRNYRSSCYDPSNPKRVYVATRGKNRNGTVKGGAWVTEDIVKVVNGTGSWRKITDNTMDFRDLRDIWVDPNNSNYVFIRSAGSGSNGSIYRGVRNGNNYSWTNMLSGAKNTGDLYIWDRGNGQSWLVAAGNINNKYGVHINKNPRANDWNNGANWEYTGMDVAKSLQLKPEKWVRPNENITFTGLAAHGDHIIVLSQVTNHKKGNGAFIGKISSNGQSVTWSDWTLAPGNNRAIENPNGLQAKIREDDNGTPYYYVAMAGTGPWRRQVSSGPAPCLTVSKSSHSFTSDAGSTTASVSSNQGWTVSDNKGWITATKSGNNVNISVTANTSTVARTGTVTIDGCINRTISISQEGATACSLTLSSSNESFAQGGGTTTVNVSTTENFTISENLGWITTSKSGNTVTITAAANGGSNTRTGTININGCQNKQIAVSQAGVVAGPSQTPFLGQNSTIPGKIEAEHYDFGGQGVAYNDDNNRTGDLSFRPADKVDVYAKSQASGGRSIGWSISGEWVEFTTDVTAGTYDIVFTYSSGGNPGDLKVSLDGSQIALFTDISNTGGWSNFTTTTLEDIDIAGGNDKVLRLEYFNGGSFDMDVIEFIKKDGPACTLDVASSSASFGAGASSQTIAVTTTENFTVSDNKGFITATKSGNNVVIQVAANGSTNSRTGTVTVNGCENKTISVTQAGATPCTLTLSKSSHAFGASAGSTSVNVTSAQTFTVSKSAGWITATKSGNTVNISVSPNNNTSSRSGTVTVDGCQDKTVSITQAGAAPPSEGGSETFNKMPTANQWSNGSFKGDEGFNWTYTKAKRTNSINGKTIKLDNSANGSLRANIPGGFSQIKFKARPTGSKQNSGVEVFVGNTSVGKFNVPKNATKTITINVSGAPGAQLRFKGFNNSDIQLDDISWEGTTSARTIGSAPAPSTGYRAFISPNPTTTGVSKIWVSEPSILYIKGVDGTLLAPATKIPAGSTVINDIKPGLYIVNLISLKSKARISKKLLSK